MACQAHGKPAQRSWAIALPQQGRPEKIAPVYVPSWRLYGLIFTSRKPEAKRFRKWVTSEVLPAIRQTGRYCGYSASGPTFARGLPD